MTDTIESLRADLAALSARIDAVAKAAEKEWPQVGDQVWIVGSTGAVFEWAWHDNPDNYSLLSAGSVCRTEAEALRVGRAATAMRILRRLADEDRAAHPHYIADFRCWSGSTMSVGPRFVTIAARDAAQAQLEAMGPEYLEALA